MYNTFLGIFIGPSIHLGYGARNELHAEPLETITAALVDDSDIFHWSANVRAACRLLQAAGSIVIAVIAVAIEYRSVDGPVVHQSTMRPVCTVIQICLLRT